MKTQSTKSTHKILFACMALLASAGQAQAACTTVNLPGYDSSDVRMQAEDYCSMVGVKTQATMDVGSGLQVTNLDSGDSMTYKINVPNNIPLPAEYSLTTRIADVTGKTPVWVNSTSKFIATKSGVQDYVFTVGQGSYILNWFEFSYATPPAVPTISVKGNQIFALTPNNTSPLQLRQLLADKKIQRLVVPVEGDGGYLMDPATQKARISAAVQAAAHSEQYLIINWNSSMAHLQQAAAMTFFEDMAREYGKLPYIIYELNDKPGANVSWANEIKPYANNVIQAIRAIDPDNLIIVGTPNQSQAVEMPAADPIIGTNIAYALSFNVAANSPLLKARMNSDAHALRERVLTALESDIAFVATDWNFDPQQTNASDEYREWSYFAKATGIADVSAQSTTNTAFTDKFFINSVSGQFCPTSTSPDVTHPHGRHILLRYACSGTTGYYWNGEFNQYNSNPQGSVFNIPQDVMRVRARSAKGGELILQQGGSWRTIKISATGTKFQTFTSDARLTDGFFNGSLSFSLRTTDGVTQAVTNDVEIHWLSREELVPGGAFAQIDRTTTKVVASELGGARLDIQGSLASGCEELVEPIQTLENFGRTLHIAVYSRPKVPAQPCTLATVPFAVSVNVALDKNISVNNGLVYRVPVSSSSVASNISSSSAVTLSVASSVESSRVSSSKSSSSAPLTSYSGCSSGGYLTCHNSSSSRASWSSKASVVSSSSKTSVPSSSVMASNSSRRNSFVVETGTPEEECRFFTRKIVECAVASRAIKVIEAEQYGSMSGVQTEVTKDVGGGRNVGYIDRGDWMSYSNIPVEIPVTGQYEVEYRLASQKSGGSFDLIEAGSGAKLDSVNFPATGDWQAWRSWKQSLTLSKGTHRFSLKATSGGWNINLFIIRKVN